MLANSDIATIDSSAEQASSARFFWPAAVIGLLSLQLVMCCIAVVVSSAHPAQPIKVDYQRDQVTAPGTSSHSGSNSGSAYHQSTSPK